MKKPIFEPKPQFEPKSYADRVLPDSELDGVSGGMLQSAFSNAIKSIGEGISTMARKG